MLQLSYNSVQNIVLLYHLFVRRNLMSNLGGKGTPKQLVSHSDRVAAWAKDPTTIARMKANAAKARKYGKRLSRERRLDENLMHVQITR